MIIYQSEFSRNMNFNHIKKNIDSKVILNGSNWNFDKKSSNRNRLIVGSVQFMKPKKRAHLVPEVLKLIKNKKMSCVMIGDIHASLKPALGDYFPSTGPLQTILVKQQENAQVRKILKMLKVYISLSYEDPCPNSILEASRLMIPIVATNAGGHPELLYTNSLVDEEVPDAASFVPHFSPSQIKICEIESYAETIQAALAEDGYATHPHSYRSYDAVFEEYLRSVENEI